MSSINYPSNETNGNIEIVNSSVLGKKIAKIKTVKDNRNLFHTFLNCSCREYQNETDIDKKNSICKVFNNQILDYIKSDTSVSPGNIYNKFKQSSLNEEIKSKFSLHLLGEERNIFKTVMVKKNTDDDFVNLNLAYNMFSKKTNEEFLPTSLFFSILNDKLIVKMLSQRFTIKNYEERIKNIKKHLEDSDMTSDDIDKFKEIIDYNNKFCNNLEPLNFIEMLKTGNKTNELLLNLFSLIFKLNIFLCRSWSNDISVIKEIRYEEDSPCIIIFKYSGKISMTGIDVSTFYETGGIMLKNDIVTILNKEKHSSVIKRFRETIGSGMDNFLSEKYNNYLNTLDNTENVDKLEDKYGKELDKIKYFVENNENVPDIGKNRHQEKEHHHQEKEHRHQEKEHRHQEKEHRHQEHRHQEHRHQEHRHQEKEHRHQEKKHHHQEKKHHHQEHHHQEHHHQEHHHQEHHHQEKEMSYEEEMQYYENFRNNNIPYFIIKYTDNELINLYKLFIDPNVDLENMDRLNMEIQYTNYLLNDSTEP